MFIDVLHVLMAIVRYTPSLDRPIYVDSVAKSQRELVADIKLQLSLGTFFKKNHPLQSKIMYFSFGYCNDMSISLYSYYPILVGSLPA